MTIIISRDVIDYLEDLVFILRDKGYFNFLEDAEEYVNMMQYPLPFRSNVTNKLRKN